MLRICLPGLLLLLATSASAAPLFPVPSGEKLGFINEAGVMVIPPRFDQLGPYAEGMWPVRQGNSWGFVDEATQSLAIEPRFENAARFSEGLCAVVWKKKIGYIGKNGKWQIAPGFLQEDTYDLWKENTLFKSGVAGAYLSEEQAEKANFPGQAGFIDRRGKWVISPRFQDVEPFSDGMAKIEILKEYSVEEGYTDMAGKFWLLPENCVGLFAEPFSEGLAAVPQRSKTRDGLVSRFGFLNKEGKWAIPPRYLTVAPSGLFSDIRQGFRDGICPVLVGSTRENARLGWIGKDGNWVIEPKFTGGAGGASGTWSPAALGKRLGEGLVGYVDRSGQYMIEPTYEKVGLFQEGLAPVKAPKRKWGYIDSAGKEVIPPRFDYAPVNTIPAAEVMGLQFNRGLAWVREGEKQGYINQRGDWVWSRTIPKSESRN